MANKYVFAVFLLFVAMSLTGCMEKESKEGYGTLLVKITDAPSYNITAAIVNISYISVHKSNDSEGEWFDVFNGSRLINLTAIKGVKEILGSAELPAGNYTQIRLYIRNGTVLVNGSEYNLMVPSDSIKLVKEFEINSNETTTLLLDFDAEKSIHHAKDRFILVPVITVEEE